MNKLTFQDFRDGMGGSVCERIGFDVGDLTSWREYTKTFVQENSKQNGDLVDAIRRFDGVASSGERAVLHAAIAAADFAWLADELAQGTHWARVEKLGDNARRAIAAAVLYKDAD